MKKQKLVVLGVTGSIAAYKAADLVRRLQDKNFRVSVIMTKEAQKFISTLTLASLSGSKVHVDMFEEACGDWTIGHVHLADEADLLLIAPATANIIGKIAAGIADDLLTCTAMATRAPAVIAPAMNEGMYTNPVVQENCRKLQKMGAIFVGPQKGNLACGIVGQGHLADVEAIVNEVEKILKKSSTPKK